MNTNNNVIKSTIKSTRTLWRSVLGVALVGLSSITHAIPMLYDIRYNPVPTGETQLQLVFDEKLNTEPKVRVVGESTSIELFFQQAEFEESLKALSIDKAGIQGITSELRDGGFAVSINMDELKLYKTEVKNNLVIVEVSNKPIVSEQDQSQKVTAFINQIQAIDFRRGEKGEAKVLAFLEHNQAAIDVQERGGKIIADFHHIDIAEDLLYELDVLDFGTVVSRIETFKEDNKSRIVIEPNAAFKFTYQQLDNIFTLSVEKDEGNKTFGDKKEYKGQPITLNFQDIPIRSVLQIIADTNNFNLVTSDTVSGNITLR